MRSGSPQSCTTSSLSYIWRAQREGGDLGVWYIIAEGCREPFFGNALERQRDVFRLDGFGVRLGLLLLVDLSDFSKLLRRDTGFLERPRVFQRSDGHPDRLASRLQDSKEADQERGDSISCACCWITVMGPNTRCVASKGSRWGLRKGIWQEKAFHALSQIDVSN